MFDTRAMTGLPTPFLLPACVIVLACADRRAPADDRTEPAAAVLSSPIWTLSDGDLVYPRFSPDGNELVFAAIVDAGDQQSVELWAADFETGERRLLLDAHTALRYATYGSFVVRLEWPAADSIVVALSDGDVDVTEVALSPLDGRMLAETYIEPGIDPLPPERLELADTLAALHAQWPALLVEHVARDAVMLPDDRIIYQKAFAGEDSGLWQLYLRTGAADTIRGVSAPIAALRLTDAVVRGDVALLLLHSSTRALLIRVHEGVAFQEIDLQGERVGRQLEVRRDGPETTSFLVRLGSSSQPGTDHLYVFGGDGIRRALPVDGLFDADLHAGRVLLNVWHGDQRRIQAHR